LRRCEQRVLVEQENRDGELPEHVELADPGELVDALEQERELVASAKRGMSAVEALEERIVLRAARTAPRRRRAARAPARRLVLPAPMALRRRRTGTALRSMLTAKKLAHVVRASVRAIR
jgi:hypothetical protein